MQAPEAFPGLATLPLCVVGNLNRDIKVLGAPHAPSLFQDGETSVPQIQETIGGGGANSACAAAALGGNVRFLGKVGADELGTRLARALESHRVRACLAQSPQCATGTTVALGFATGQRHFLSCLPNNESLALADLDLSKLEGCAHLLRADVWFSPAMLAGGNQHLFAQARSRGLAISLDINFDPYWSTGRAEDIARRKQQLREVLRFVDLAHGNTRELCAFSDAPSLEAALERLTEWGVKAVIIHLGAKGAGYYEAGQLTVEPPCPAAHILHSTGTGDVLSICLILLHHRKDLSVQEKLRAANRIVCEFMEGRLNLIPSL